MSEKKRLTLTGNKMPDEIYSKLEELGNQRKLTPYVLGLIEKEEKTDKLIESLSALTNKIDNVEHIVVNLNQKFESASVQTSPLESTEIKTSNIETIQEGRLEISDNIEGGIEEDIEDMDF